MCIWPNSICMVHDLPCILLLYINTYMKRIHIQNILLNCFEVHSLHSPQLNFVIVIESINVDNMIWSRVAHTMQSIIQYTTWTFAHIITTKLPWYFIFIQENSFVLLRCSVSTISTADQVTSFAKKINLNGIEWSWNFIQNVVCSVVGVGSDTLLFVRQVDVYVLESSWRAGTAPKLFCRQYWTDVDVQRSYGEFDRQMVQVSVRHQLIV